MKKSNEKIIERFKNEHPIRKASIKLSKSSEKEFEKAKRNIGKLRLAKALCEEIPDGVAKGVCSFYAIFGYKINEIWRYPQRLCLLLLKLMRIYP